MQCGDLVVLGDAVPQEYRGFHAIVTKVAESHCTVNDLDNSLQLGECWPSLHDVSLHSCLLRLGTHVVINGLACSRTKHFNGLASLDANEACMLGVNCQYFDLDADGDSSDADKESVREESGNSSEEEVRTSVKQAAATKAAEFSPPWRKTKQTALTCDASMSLGMTSDSTTAGASSDDSETEIQKSAWMKPDDSASGQWGVQTAGQELQAVQHQDEQEQDEAPQEALPVPFQWERIFIPSSWGMKNETFEKLQSKGCPMQPFGFLQDLMSLEEEVDDFDDFNLPQQPVRPFFSPELCPSIRLCWLLHAGGRDTGD